MYKFRSTRVRSSKQRQGPYDELAARGHQLVNLKYAKTYIEHIYRVGHESQHIVVL